MAAVPHPLLQPDCQKQHGTVHQWPARSRPTSMSFHEDKTTPLTPPTPLPSLPKPSFSCSLAPFSRTACQWLACTPLQVCLHCNSIEQQLQQKQPLQHLLQNLHQWYRHCLKTQSEHFGCFSPSQVRGSYPDACSGDCSYLQ